jgi:pseudouridine synthase
MRHALIVAGRVRVDGRVVRDPRAAVVPERIRVAIDGQAQAVERRKTSNRESLLVVELIEGRNREICRMMAAVGHEVIRLPRVEIGGISIAELPAGRWRTVSNEELRRAFPGYRRRG